MSFFSDFQNLNLMTSQLQISSFRMQRTYGGKFCWIPFKNEHDLELSHPVFAIENQQNWLVTSDFTRNCAKVLARLIFPQNGRGNQNCPT